MTQRNRLLATLVAVAACGGGPDPIAPPPPPPPPPPLPTLVTLVSDAGDFIGGGATYRYTQADAKITVAANAERLTIAIKGDDDWVGEFQAPAGLSRLERAEYTNLQRYPFNPSAAGGMSWSGNARGCNTLRGSFGVDSVTYVSNNLTAIDLHFEQHCEGAAPALRGTIRWRAGDLTAPAGPVTPVPSGLWAPAAGSTPATGNFFYLDSDPGDYIGGGQVRTLTQRNAIVLLTETEGHVAVRVSGDELWQADFAPMNVRTRLEVGYYPNLRRFPFHNPTRGGMAWYGDGRGCNELTGWFAVDQVTYANGLMTALDLRFEQHCEGAGPALHGAIRWRADDPTKPPGPVTPIPESLWKPAAGTVPATGNYLWLESDAGDWVGGGQTYLYTPQDAVIGVVADRGHLSITIDQGLVWMGDFQVMNVLSQFEPGYYPDLRRYPFHNPAKGGLAWGGMGRGCNALRGWFIVDRIDYAGGSATALDLRFEQHCDGGGPALRGAIHWAR